MHSTLNSRQSDDPHDVLVVAPDVALVAPTQDELSKLARLAHDSARRPPETQARKGPEFLAGDAVPPVDTTFRASAVNAHDQRPRRPVGGRAQRAVTALLVAACIGGAAIGWQSFGYAAKQIVGKWVPQFVMTSSLPQETPSLSAQPGAAPMEANAATATPSQAAAPVQTAPQGGAPPAAAPAPESAQLFQTMARDLARMGQELDQLKASIEQVKVNQQQMARDFANSSEANSSQTKASEVKASEVKPSEPNLRPRRSAPPPRLAAVPARQRMLSYPPRQAAAYAPLPQTGASYGTRQVVPPPPPPMTLPQDDRELSSVPRPPMPVR